MKQFNGEYGCSTCFDTGKTVGKHSLDRIWPYTPNMKYRTHKSVVKCAFEATKSGVPVCLFVENMLAKHTCFVQGFTHLTVYISLNNSIKVTVRCKFHASVLELLMTIPRKKSIFLSSLI